VTDNGRTDRHRTTQERPRLSFIIIIIYLNQLPTLSRTGNEYQRLQGEGLVADWGDSAESRKLSWPEHTVGCTVRSSSSSSSSSVNSERRSLTSTFSS